MRKFKQELIRRHRKELCYMLETLTDRLEEQTRELVEELEGLKMTNEFNCRNRDEYKEIIQAQTSKLTSGFNLVNLWGRSFGPRKFKNLLHQGFEQQILVDIENARSAVQSENTVIEFDNFEMQDLEENIKEIEEKIVIIEEVYDLLIDGSYPLNCEGGEDDSWKEKIGFVF